MNARAHILVSGQVQGVGYRSFLVKRAMRINVQGWVRNIEKGMVEIVCEGRKEDVLILVEQCKRGPQFARVSNVDVKWENGFENIGSFFIKY